MLKRYITYDADEWTRLEHMYGGPLLPMEAKRVFYALLSRLPEIELKIEERVRARIVHELKAKRPKTKAKR